MSTWMTTARPHWSMAQHQGSTRPPPPASAARLQATDVYVDDLNCLVQVSPAQLRRATEMVLQGIKNILTYLPEKFKESVSTKKALQGDEYWAVEKEILGWILNSEAGTFSCPLTGSQI